VRPTTRVSTHDPITQEHSSCVLSKPFPHVLSANFRIGVDAGEFAPGDTRRNKYHADCAVCMRCGCLHDGPQRLTSKIPQRRRFVFLRRLLDPALNGRGYTASSHVASAFVTSSESVLLIKGRPWRHGLAHLRLPCHQRRGQRQGGAKAPGAQVSGTHAGQTRAPFPC
jgi:hypothetical protein